MATEPPPIVTGDAGPGPQPRNVPDEAPEVLFPVTAGTIPPEAGWMVELQRCWKEMGLPGCAPDSFAAREGKANQPLAEADISRYIADLDLLVRDELADLTPHRKIPSEKRTRPMTLKEAAALMRLGGGKKGAERLRAAINDGTVSCETLTREQHVFSKLDFPEAVWDQLS
jgi:hypothetical protein